MALPSITPISPRAYHRVTLFALVCLVAIVVTGAAVRLTGSGLGCTDWPNCEEGRLIAPLELHPMVEFVNRVFTGLVSLAVILAVLGALVRRPRRRDLTWLAAGLVVGVIGQIVLGGITVLTDLHPAAVQGHFVLSVLLVWDATVLHHRSGEEIGGPYGATVPRAVRRLALALVVLTFAVVVTGTIVTGSGPHGGDETARRFGYAIGDVARVHGISVVVLLGTTLALVWLARRAGAWAPMSRSLGVLLWVIVAQGTIGYAQYFSGVPAGLVLLHVAGSILVFIAVLHVVFATRRPAGQVRTAAVSGDSAPSLAATS
jgi:cytochrome c oxidase assembly protein subunit 15